MRSALYHVVGLALLQMCVLGDEYSKKQVQNLLQNSKLYIQTLKFRGETSKECRRDIQRWMYDLERAKRGNCGLDDASCKDALKQLDAFARFYDTSRSSNIYEGSHRQCLSLNENEGSFRRKYCYLMHSDKKENCRNDKHAVLFNRNRTAFAICAPESCHGKDFQVIFDNLKKPFDFMIDKPVCAVFCGTRDIPKKNMFYGTTSFLIFLSLAVVFSSLYDYWRDKKYGISLEDEEDPCQKMMLAWSLWSNCILIFKDNSPGYIKSLDPIRAITFTWIVGQNIAAHLGFYDETVRVDPNNFSFWESALSSLIPIYTYLFLSGLTLSYTFIKAKHPQTALRNPITWIVFYFHRWTRLTSALVIFIGFFDAYGKYIQGPYDALTGYSIANQTDSCTYWKDIIHISNFMRVDEMCYAPAWHLAIDFQFTLFAPIFLISFWYSGFFGVLFSVAVALISSVSVFIFYLHEEKYLESAFRGDHTADELLVEVILSKPWNQLAPYLLGMVVGYILVDARDRKPHLHPVIYSIIWVIVVPTGVAAIAFGNYGTSKFGKPTTNIATRGAWTLCLSWIIVASHLKWAGPITNFLEHPFWRPFGKLSFCAFLAHHMIMYHLFNLEEKAPRHVSFWHQYFHYTIPCVLYSFFVAFFLSVMVELPIMRLDRILYEKYLPTSLKEEAEESASDKNASNTLEDNDDETLDEKQDSDNGPLLRHEF